MASDGAVGWLKQLNVLLERAAPYLILIIHSVTHALKTERSSFDFCSDISSKHLHWINTNMHSPVTVPLGIDGSASGISSQRRLQRQASFVCVVPPHGVDMGLYELVLLTVFFHVCDTKWRTKVIDGNLTRWLCLSSIWVKRNRGYLQRNQEKPGRGRTTEARIPPRRSDSMCRLVSCLARDRKSVV